MFWPTAPQVASLEGGDTALSGGLTYIALLEALRPVGRTLTALGHAIDGVLIRTPVHMAGDCDRFDMPSQEWSNVPWPGDAANSDAFTVLIETSPVPELFPRNPAVAPLNFAIPLPIAPSFSSQLPPDPDSSDTPSDLDGQIDEFLDLAIAEIGSRHAGEDSPPRGQHMGLLWLLDGIMWDGIGRQVQGTLFKLVRRAYNGRQNFLNAILRNDISHMPGPTFMAHSEANLHRVGLRSGAGSDNHIFWRGLRRDLQARGESIRLRQLHTLRLAPETSKASVWDMVLELIAEGVIRIDSLLVPPPMIDPLRLAELDPGNRLERAEVWGGDMTITVQLRELYEHEPGDRVPDITERVAWDTRPGSATERPAIIIVAARGVAVLHSWKAGQFGWDLIIHRVQNDGLVPPRGAAINLQALMATTVVEVAPDSAPAHRDAKAIVVPKHDGCFLQFPAWGDPALATGPVSGRDVPFVIEITVDPARSDHAYTFDVRYFSYTQFGGGLPSASRRGCHFVVWASEGVAIESATSLTSHDWLGYPVTGTGSLVSTPADPAPNHVRSNPLWFPEWKTSGEFWRVEDPTRLPVPLSKDLPVTSRALLEPLPGDATVADDDGTVTRHVHDGQEVPLGHTLRPASHLSKKHGYRDDFWFSLGVDIAIGATPLVGDLADVGELLLMLSTGEDKWGRPATNFDIAMTAVGACVPLVSGAMMVRAGQRLTDGTVTLQLSLLEELFRRAKAGNMVNLEHAHAALQVPPSYRSLTREGARFKSDTNLALAQELLAAVQNPAVLAKLTGAVDHILDNAGSWPRVDDLLHDGKFILPTLENAYQRQLKAHPARTRAEFLGTARGQAKLIIDALVAPAGLPPRRAAQVTRVPSEAGRPAIKGAIRTTASLTPAEIVPQIKALVQGMADGSIDADILSSGALRKAEDVLSSSDDVDAIVDALVAQAGRVAASRGGNTVQRLAGKSTAVSQAELEMRIAKGVVAAIDESRRSLGSPADLIDGAVVGETLECVRKFVTREWEHGARLELSKALELDAAVSTMPNHRIRFQQDLPVSGTQAVDSGFDAVVIRGTAGQPGQLAIPLQLKSTNDPRAMLNGTVTWSTDASGAAVKVKGPSITAQAFKDPTRTKIWNHTIPPDDFVPPSSGLPTPDTDWIDVAPVTVFMVDDVHLADEMTARLHKAIQAQNLVDGTPDRTVLDLTAMDMPEPLRRQLREALAVGPDGQTIPPPDTIDLATTSIDDIVESWLIAEIPRLEGEVNDLLADATVAGLGRPGAQVIIARATEPIDDVLERVDDVLSGLDDLSTDVIP